MKKKIFSVLILTLFYLLFTGSSGNRTEGKSSGLKIEKLTFRGLPMKTTRNSLIKLLGKPDLEEEKESVQPKSQGKFGKNISYRIYTYRVGEGSLSFSVYEDQAVIFLVRFSDDLILKYGNMELSGRLRHDKALKLFNAASATETSNGIKRKLLIFKSNSKSKLNVYATPILKFTAGKLESLFYYPEF